MALIQEGNAPEFNLDELKKGMLVWAKNAYWDEGKGGFIAKVSKREMIVQYHPDISNVVNHFIIRQEEVEGGEWETIRYSEDMETVHVYPEATEATGGGEPMEDADDEI